MNSASLKDPTLRNLCFSPSETVHKEAVHIFTIKNIIEELLYFWKTLSERVTLEKYIMVINHILEKRGLGSMLCVCVESEFYRVYFT